jgi:hypothetical protein
MIRSTARLLCVLVLVPVLAAPLASLAPLARASTFVLDPGSTSWPESRDLLSEGPVGGPPRLEVPGDALGLVEGDVIDAISDGLDRIDNLPPAIAAAGIRSGVLFSVSRQSAGAPGTGVERERLSDSAPPAGGAPFGHPSDLFLYSGTSGSNVLAPAPDGWGVEGGDEAYAGLVNPAADPPFPGDDVSAYDRSTIRIYPGPGSAPPPRYEEGGEEEGEPDSPDPEEGDLRLRQPVFFSLRAGSPTLAAIGASPADILVAGGGWGRVPAVFVTAETLGIPPASDLDALSLLVEASDSSVIVPAKALLSVTSRTAGFALASVATSGTVVDSGADVIEFDGRASRIAYDSSDLGLLTGDDLDALEGITIWSQPYEVFPVGGAEVEPRDGGFAVTEIGESGEDGIRIDLGAALSWGGSFSFDHDVGELMSVAIEEAAWAAGEDDAGTASVASRLEIERQGDQVSITVSDARSDAVLIEVLDGEDVVRSITAHPEANPLGLSVALGAGAEPLSFIYMKDIVVSGYSLMEVEELHFGGEDIGWLICAGGECAWGDGVRLSTVCNDGSPAVYYLRSAEVTGRGFDGFEYRSLRPSPSVAEVFRRGDTDGSGRVEMTDAVRSLAFLFLSGPEPTCLDAADSNDSGELDISDPINTLGVLFLGVGAIPAPGLTACGLDPTADELGCAAPAGCDSE